AAGSGRDRNDVEAPHALRTGRVVAPTVPAPSLLGSNSWTPHRASAQSRRTASWQNPYIGMLLRSPPARSLADERTVSCFAERSELRFEQHDRFLVAHHAFVSWRRRGESGACHER